MSTSTIFKFPSVIRGQHEGPLGIHIDMYEALLGEHGYSRSSTYVHLHIVADLSRWLKRQRLNVGDVDERTVALAKTRPLTGKHARFRPEDRLLEFLTEL